MKWRDVWYDNTKETIENADSNDTSLEPSESSSNTKDVKKYDKKDNNTKWREQDDHNDTENKNKNNKKELIVSAVALTQVSIEKKDITSRKKKGIGWRIPRAKMKMKR